jgi:hypothetical protein
VTSGSVESVELCTSVLHDRAYVIIRRTLCGGVHLLVDASLPCQRSQFAPIISRHFGHLHVPANHLRHLASQLAVTEAAFRILNFENSERLLG